MGQWGALGYALQGLTYHPDPDDVLRDAQRGGSTTVGAAAQRLERRLDAGDRGAHRQRRQRRHRHVGLAVHRRRTMLPAECGGSVPADRGRTTSGTWTRARARAGCAGPWTPGGHQRRQPHRHAGYPSRSRPTATWRTRRCSCARCGGNITVRGTIQGTVNSTDAARTVNVRAARAVRGRRDAVGVAGVVGGTRRRRRTPGARGPGRRGPLLRDEHLRGPAGLLRLRRHLRLHAARTTPASPTRTPTTDTAVTDHGQRGRPHAQRRGGEHPVLVVDGRVQRGRDLRGGSRPRGLGVRAPARATRTTPGRPRCRCRPSTSAYPQIGTLRRSGCPNATTSATSAGRVLQMTLQGSAQSVDRQRRHLRRRSSPSTACSRTGSP